tara:strand:- start:255 stop:578 length:324 start_codon:yes stop_codon:yes gene_type:complete
MTATWTITAMDRVLKQGDKADVVTVLHYDVTDSETVGDDTFSGRVYSTVGLAEPGDTFTPYSDITAETAVAWAKAALGDDAVASAEASVAAQIAEAKTPITGTGVPW